MAQRPRLSELSPDELLTRAHEYRCMAASASTPGTRNALVGDPVCDVGSRARGQSAAGRSCRGKSLLSCYTVLLRVLVGCVEWFAAAARVADFPSEQRMLSPSGVAVPPSWAGLASGGCLLVRSMTTGLICASSSARSW